MTTVFLDDNSDDISLYDLYKLVIVRYKLRSLWLSLVLTERKLNSSNIFIIQMNINMIKGWIWFWGGEMNFTTSQPLSK